MSSICTCGPTHPKGGPGWKIRVHDVVSGTSWVRRPMAAAGTIAKENWSELGLSVSTHERQN